MSTDAMPAVLPGTDLTDAQLDLADRTLLLMDTKIPSFTWTAGALARALGVPATEMPPVLRWLAQGCWIRTHGKGSRERFGRWANQR